MEIRPLSDTDIPKMWEINEQGLPGTGKVDENGLKELLECSEIAVGTFDDKELRGYVICLPPATKYGSLNYGWFNSNMEDFLYVDRIAVESSYRDQGIGSLLYSHIIDYTSKSIAAEVSLDPPNLASMRFHHRFDFKKIGELHHESYSVNLMLRD